MKTIIKPALPKRKRGTTPKLAAKDYAVRLDRKFYAKLLADIEFGKSELARLQSVNNALEKNLTGAITVAVSKTEQLRVSEAAWKLSLLKRDEHHKGITDAFSQKVIQLEAERDCAKRDIADVRSSRDEWSKKHYSLERRFDLQQALAVVACLLWAVLAWEWVR